MIMTVDLYKFRRAFELMERTNFSFEGLEILFDHIESLEDDLGCNSELDPIALCCDYTEYKDEAELLNDYSLKSIEAVEEKTEVLEFYTVENNKPRYIIRNF